MISVCMATYNGSKFIKEQIDSILCQLSMDDELVISDDHSTDETFDIINSYNDSRIKFYFNSRRKGCTHNFEHALMHASGDYIFLADQDDVWLPHKIETMVDFLVSGNYDLVMSNCILVDERLSIIKNPFFDESCPMKRSILSNLYRCVCLGCCLVFTRKALNVFLPFPEKVVLHDLWIYLVAIINLKCGYCNDALMLYRRHQDTVTFAGKKNTNSLLFKIRYRLYVFPHLIWRSLKYRFTNI